jgi:hypothetical protein
MKKMLLLWGLLGMLIPAQAQYYYLSRSINQNPGGLNTSAELPFGLGLDPAWTTIFSGGLSTPAWSSPQIIPFQFAFNGTPVGAYKVSSSGVLTFNVAATDAPPFANATIPSAAIPSPSVCVWGLKGDFPDDKIVTRTFGTAPNRQHWVMFANFNYEGGNPACNLYWSIVLEEGTNSIYLVDQRNFITCLPSLTLGLQYDATNALMVTGSPNIGSKATNLSDPSDNHYYEFVPGVQPDYDFSGIKMLTPSFVEINKTPIQIKGKFDNLGAKTPESLDVFYQIDNQTPAKQHLTSLSGMPDLTHSVPWKPTATGTYAIKMWVANPDGIVEARSANDTIRTSITVVNALPDKMALLEHATQHNCGPCAALNPGLEALLENNEQKHYTAIIKYHTWWPGANNDPMYQFNTADNAARVNYYDISGVPTAVISGNVFDGSPSGVTVNLLNQARSDAGMINIDITETIVNDSLRVTVNAVPVGVVNSNNLKLRVAVVQDMLSYPNATGTNGEKDFPDVMRYYLPNANGVDINNTIGATTTISAQRNLPAIFRKSVVRVVAYVQDDTDKSIYMATKSHGHFLCANGTELTGAVDINDASCTTNDGSVTVAPSGGSGNYTYTWTNAVSSTNSASNLAPGKYTVTVDDGAGCVMPFFAVVERKTPPVVLADVQNISCAGQTDGAIRLVTGGGDGPLSFSWNNGQTTDALSALAPGLYIGTVSDTVGCTTTVTANISAPSPLSITAATTTPDNGTLNGTATVTAAGGTKPYTYEWNTNPVQTTAVATGLATGTYKVTVKDYNNCVVAEEGVVVESNVSIEDELALGVRTLNLSPNPTTAMTWMELALDQPEAVSLLVTDLQGKVVLKKGLSASTDHQTLIDLSNQPAGIYVLRVTTTQGSVHRKLVRE